MKTLWQSILYGIRALGERKMYLFAMVGVPIGCALFFLTLMDEGLPLKTPVAVVDLDHSSMSRSMTRSLDAEELVDIVCYYNSYDEAMEAVRRGEVYGFYFIPEDFQKDAVAGRTPTISFYSNMTYFVPGTLTYKGFKTMAVTTSGGIVKTTLVSAGANPSEVGGLLQPVVIQDHPIGNPWTNYSIYLSNSFIPGVLELMILLVTVFTITVEIKHGTSPRWLQTAGGSMVTALTGKLLPQTVIFWLVGLAVNGMLYGFCHFPVNGSFAWLTVAMLLFVVACQGLGVLIACALHNPRLGLSVAALIGILAFSIAAFSYPVQSMYGAIGIFSYILPVRYYFLCYANIALNGYPIYFSRVWMAAMVVFTVVPLALVWRLKRACLKPVYIP